MIGLFLVQADMIFSDAGRWMAFVFDPLFVLVYKVLRNIVIEPGLGYGSLLGYHLADLLLVSNQNRDTHASGAQRYRASRYDWIYLPCLPPSPSLLLRSILPPSLPPSLSSRSLTHTSSSVQLPRPACNDSATGSGWGSFETPTKPPGPCWGCLGQAARALQHRPASCSTSASESARGLWGNQCQPLTLASAHGLAQTFSPREAMASHCIVCGPAAGRCSSAARCRLPCTPACAGAGQWGP